MRKWSLQCRRFRYVRYALFKMSAADGPRSNTFRHEWSGARAPAKSVACHMAEQTPLSRPTHCWTHGPRRIGRGRGLPSGPGRSSGVGPKRACIRRAAGLDTRVSRCSECGGLRSGHLTPSGPAILSLRQRRSLVPHPARFCLDSNGFGWRDACHVDSLWSLLLGILTRLL